MLVLATVLQYIVRFIKPFYLAIICLNFEYLKNFQQKQMYHKM